MLSTPRRGPREAPTSSTANVPSDSGTGVNGSGTTTCDSTPVTTAPPATSEASRTTPAGSESASTVVCAVMVAPFVGKHRYVNEAVGTAVLPTPTDLDARGWPRQRRRIRAGRYSLGLAQRIPPDPGRCSTDDGARHARRGVHLDPGSRLQLTATPALHCAVDAHVSGCDELARLCPGLHEGGELEELAQPDLPVNGHHVVGSHGNDDALSRAGRLIGWAGSRPTIGGMLRRIDLRGSDRPDLADVLPRATLDVEAALAQVLPIIADVREHGATALRDLAERFDGVRPQHLRVPAAALREALAGLDPQVRTALELSIEHNRAGHGAQLPAERDTEILPGGHVRQRWVPVARVGLYVPGGLAVYPS